MKPKPDRGDNRWQKTTRWINADACLAFTHILMTQLDSLWAVARLRYLDEPGSTVHGVPFESPDRVDKLWHGEQEMGISEMGEQLIYWEESRYRSFRGARQLLNRFAVKTGRNRCPQHLTSGFPRRPVGDPLAHDRSTPAGRPNLPRISARF